MYPNSSFFFLEHGVVFYLFIIETWGSFGCVDGIVGTFIEHWVVL